MTPRTQPRRPGAAVPRDVSRMLREVALATCGLVVPVECACGREGVYLCPECAELLRGPARQVQSVCPALQVVDTARVRDEGPGSPAGVDYRSPFPVLAIGEYAGNLQRLVVDWKNRGALHRTEAFAEALAGTIREIIGSQDPEDVLLVPVPSSLRSRIRRGEDHMGLLSRHLTRLTGSPTARVRGHLGASQSGRGARQRRRRILRSGGLRGVPRSAGREDSRIILLDDVVTTGSTLRAIHEGAGLQGRTIAAVVVASARWPASIHL